MYYNQLVSTNHRSIKSIIIEQQLRMQERIQQEAIQHNQMNQQPQLITIDQKWIAKDCFLKLQLITCPVCYCIPLDYPKQCQKCQRIFCHTDYQIISNGDNRCPNCKAEPWLIKKQIHITYKHMFDSLIFKCDLCHNTASKQEFNKNQLIHHLQNEHNRYLSDESILYDYTFINDKGQEIKLNSTQNIQINFKRNEGMVKFEVAGIAGRVLSIDLKEMIANHHQLGKCRIVRERSKTIKKNHQYLMWIVNISDADENEERIVFYSQELQNLLEKNYQDFQRNQRLNEFCLDVRETRYRISFVNKTQTNTYTRAEKRIMRLSVIFR